MSKLNDLKEKAMKAFKDIFSSEEIVKLEEMLQPAGEPKMTLIEVKAKDGASLFVTEVDENGLPKANTAVYSDIEGTAKPADSSYDLDSGVTIVIVDGMITEVKPTTVSEESAIEMAIEKANIKFAKERSEFEVKLAAIKKENNEEIAKLKEANVTLSNMLKKIIDTPIVTKFAHDEKREEKKYDEMSNAEKMRHNRGEKIYK